MMKFPIIIACLIALLPGSCVTKVETDRISDERIAKIKLLSAPPLSDSNQNGFWRTGNAAELGLNEQALREHIALCEKTGADSQVVIYKGVIVSEWYSPRYREPVGAMSSTKAITGLLVGILLDRGNIKSLDETVTAGNGTAFGS
jgi:hypothetical protein